MSEQQDFLVDIAFCKRPHGIRGALKCELLAGRESTIEELRGLTAFPLSPKSSLPVGGVEVHLSRLQGVERSILWLKEVSDRTMAESWVPFKLSLWRSQLPAESEDEFYVVDLRGLEVFCHEEGKKIGEIIDSYDNGAQTVVKVSTEDGDLEIPFVEAFFPVVNFEQRYAEVVLPEWVE